jgi:hypothetical protein
VAVFVSDASFPALILSCAYENYKTKEPRQENILNRAGDTHRRILHVYPHPHPPTPPRKKEQEWHAAINLKKMQTNNMRMKTAEEHILCVDLLEECH